MAGPRDISHRDSRWPTIIIDPWIMNNPTCPASEKKVKHVDILLCTHGHGDHIGDAVEIIKQHNPQVVGIPELCGWLEKKGAKQICRDEQGRHAEESATLKSPWCMPIIPAAFRMATS